MWFETYTFTQWDFLGGKQSFYIYYKNTSINVKFEQNSMLHAEQVFSIFVISENTICPFLHSPNLYIHWRKECFPKNLEVC